MGLGTFQPYIMDSSPTAPVQVGQEKEKGNQKESLNRPSVPVSIPIMSRPTASGGVNKFYKPQVSDDHLRSQQSGCSPFSG